MKFTIFLQPTPCHQKDLIFDFDCQMTNPVLIKKKKRRKTDLVNDHHDFDLLHEQLGQVIIKALHALLDDALQLSQFSF